MSEAKLPVNNNLNNRKDSNFSARKNNEYDSCI